MTDRAMTDDELYDYAEEMIQLYALEVENLTIFECADMSPHVPGGEISDDDARKVSRLISKARVDVTWAPATGDAA